MLNGSVNANGFDTVVTFEYGTSTAYNSTLLGQPSSLVTPIPAAVSALLTDLVPGTTYHYRVNAVRGNWVVNGVDQTFTTPGTSPASKPVASWFVTPTIEAMAYGAGTYVAAGYSSGGGVLLTSSDGVSWSQRLSGGQWLSSVAYGAGKFVAVGYGGTLLTSTDSITWTPQTSGTTKDLSAVVFGNGLFFVSTGTTTSLSSQDGVNWSPHTDPTYSLSNPIFSASSFYAVGRARNQVTFQYESRILSSTDGTAWTSRTLPTADYLYGFTFSAGVFVATDDSNSLLTAADGGAWTTSTPFAWTASSVIFANNLFVVPADSGHLYTSANGTTWALRTTGTTSLLLDAAYLNGQYYAFGDSGTIVTSTDGVAWSKVDGGVPRTGLAYDGTQFLSLDSNGTLVTSPGGLLWAPHATGVTGFSLKAAAFGAGSYAVVGDNGKILTSINLTTWQTRTSGVSGTINGLAFANHLFVGVAATNAIITSSDGITWAKRSVAGTVTNLNAVAFGAGTWVALGASGTVLSSSDGTIWTARSSGTGNDLQALAFSNSVFLAVGSYGTILTSPNGLDWTVRTSGTGSDLKTVAFGNGVWLAAGANSTVLVSQDNGVSWQVSQPDLPQFSDTDVFAGAVYANGVFILSGTEPGLATPSTIPSFSANPVVQPPGGGTVSGGGTFVQGTATTVTATALAGHHFLFWSEHGVQVSSSATYTFVMTASRTLAAHFAADGDDLANWVLRTPELSGAAYGNNMYVAVGDRGGDHYFGSIFSSTDGATWTQQLSRQNAGLLGVAFGAGVFVAVGESGTIIVSPDGALWSRQPSGCMDQLNGVAYAGGRFVVVGARGTLLTSSNGLSWSAHPSATNEDLHGVAWSGQRYVAAGDHGAIVSSTDSVNWRPEASNDVGDLGGVAYGNGHFIVAGDRSVLSSSDGQTWAVQNIVIGTVVTPQYVLNSALFANGRFVVAGPNIEASADWAILSSSDGSNWTRVSTNLGHGMHVHGFAYGANKFIAVGEGGAILSSTDSLTWTNTTGGSASSNRNVIFANGVFVAVGDDGIKRSTDGISWKLQHPGKQDSVTFGNGVFVAVGSVISTSQDGITWTDTSISGVAELYSVAYGNQAFVVVGTMITAPVLLTSTDAITWKTQSLTLPSSLATVSFGNGKFVAVGNGAAILTSPDGVTWSSTLSGGGLSLSSGTFGNGAFVGVGYPSPVVSTDGITWWKTQLGQTAATAVSFANGDFLAGNTSRIASSSAGWDWEYRDTGIAGKTLLGGFAYGSGMVVGVGAGGTIVTSSVVAGASQPMIVVQEPAGTNLTSAGTPEDFGSAMVGSAVEKTFTIVNSGTASLAIGIMSTDGEDASDFSVSASGLVSPLSPGSSTTFTVKFAPSEIGARTAWVHVPSNDDLHTPFDIQVTGIGLAPAGVGTLKVTLLPAAAEAAGAKWNLDGGSWQAGGTTLSGLAEGAHTVRFMPLPGWTTPAEASVNLVGAKLVSPTGTYTAPFLDLERIAGVPLESGVAVVGFGSNTVAAGVSVVLTLRNTGALPLTGLAASVDGGNALDFQVTAAPPPTIAAGKSATMTVKFGPLAQDARFALLHVTSNDPTHQPSFDLSLTGTGTITPVITAPPMSQWASLGLPAALDVMATGGSLNYQWFKNNVAVTGATGAGYSIVKAAIAHAGAYMAKASNAVGSAPSATAYLGVVNLAPGAVTVNEAGTITLTVAAAAPGISYQWRKNGGALSNGVNLLNSAGTISGATSSALVITKAIAADADNYTCLVKMPDPQHSGTFLSMESGSFTVTVTLKPVLNAFAPGPWIVSGTVSDLVSALNNPTAFTVAGLPAGVTFNAKTGQLGGKPAVAITMDATYHLTITASNAAGTSVPLKADVIVHPLQTSAMGTFNGLMDRDTALSSGHGGTLNIVSLNTGLFSGKLTLGALGYGFVTQHLDAMVGGNPSGTVIISRKPPLHNLTLAFSINKDSGELLGTVGDGFAAPVSVHAWRNPWNATTNKASLAAVYNNELVLDPSLTGTGTTAGNIVYPQGTGFGSLTVTTAGVATWSGKMADGVVSTCSATMGPNGEVPLHFMLHGNTGSAHGWVKASGGDPNLLLDSAGTFDWRQNSQTGTILNYKAGFPLHQLTVIGAKYIKPTAANPLVMGIPGVSSGTNAKLVFSEGGLSALTFAGPPAVNIVAASNAVDLTNHGTFRIAGTATANSVSLPNPNPATIAIAINATAGSFNGSFVLHGDQDPTRATPFLINRQGTFSGMCVTRSTGSPTLTQGVGYFLLPELQPYPGLPVAAAPLLSGQILLESGQ